MSVTFHKNLVETLEFRPSCVEDTAGLLYECTKDDSKVITESGDKVDLSKLDIVAMEGVFQRADRPNKNKRVYPRALWESLLKEGGDVDTRLRERSMIGHLEHPESGATDLRKGAILITNLRLKEDGEVIGRAEVYNEGDGKMVREYIRTGTRLGISSRGSGSIDNKGVVQEDFRLETFDLVYNPSTERAHPKLTQQSNFKNEAGVGESVVTESDKGASMSLKQQIEQLLGDNDRSKVVESLVSLIEEQNNFDEEAELEAEADLVEGIQADSHRALKGAKEALTEMAEDMEASEAIIENLTIKVASLKDELEESEACLSNALDLIAALTRVSVADQVKEAVEGVIQQHPELSEFQDMLESCKSATAVEARASRLINRFAESARKEAGRLNAITERVSTAVSADIDSVTDERLRGLRENFKRRSDDDTHATVVTESTTPARQGTPARGLQIAAAACAKV